MNDETKQLLQRRFISNVDKRGLVRTDMSPCWRWCASLASTGYGQICIKGIRWNAHRLSYYIYNNFEELPEKKHICHNCDNKECCNPEHLYIGTPKENAKDVWDRGIKVKKESAPVIRNSTPCYNCVEHHKSCDNDTKEKCSHCEETNSECIKKEYIPHTSAFTSEMTKGENNIKAKLTEQQVIEILTRHKAGLKYGELKKMAEEYDIKYITIQKIVAGKLWIETYNKFNS